MPIKQEQNSSKISVQREMVSFYSDPITILLLLWILPHVYVPTNETASSLAYIRVASLSITG